MKVPSDIILYIFDMYSILCSHVKFVGSQFPLDLQRCSRGGYYIYDPDQYNLIRQLRCIYVVGTYVYMEQADKVTIG